MAEQQIRFDDGAAYEQMMGVWSRMAGEIFLDWVAPPAGARWIDVGCGNGAFTELIVQKTSPAEVQGIDPSDGQLAYARTRPGARIAQFQQGDAMALPFPDRSFDVAVMALVLFFVPDPVKGLSEMIRVVQPGGTVTAYVWDISGGGLPMAPILAEARAMGMQPALPPSFEISRMEALRDLWISSGIEDVETKEIAVTRTFDNFDEFWTNTLKGPNMGSLTAKLSPGDLEMFKGRVHQRLLAQGSGSLTYGARANAIKGRVPR